MSAGANDIIRKSSESSVTVEDRKGFKELIKMADEAVAGAGIEKSYARACGHPHRLLLPKGKPEGMKFKLYAAITKGSDIHSSYGGDDLVDNHAYCGIQGKPYPDLKPMGYPFDRRIPDAREFKIPNFHGIEVEIYHNDKIGLAVPLIANLCDI